MDNIRIEIRDEIHMDSKAIYVIKVVDSKTLVLHGEKWTKIPPATPHVKPTLLLRSDVFQQFIDKLSNKIKPTVQAEVDAELKATKYHLEDFRNLVFNKPIDKTP